MKKPVFITGIGTDVGKTLVAAVLTQALGADYWKPVQAGREPSTDAETLRQLVQNPSVKIHAPAYEFDLPASPHLSARAAGRDIEVVKLYESFQQIQESRPHQQLLIEGAGGLLVPLHQKILMADFIKLLQAEVILVSRNYLGSINHSLLTAAFCRSNDIPVLGWVFTDSYMDYEDEIVEWSGYPKIASIPKLEAVDANRVAATAAELLPALQKYFL
ncbi:MAG: dethiobiotin synthase [Sphingobacteriia bacterium]|nr:MAG: dethiobiotin synthase [Sphingobacteriia bacterium]